MVKWSKFPSLINHANMFYSIVWQESAANVLHLCPDLGVLFWRLEVRAVKEKPRLALPPTAALQDPAGKNTAGWTYGAKQWLTKWHLQDMAFQLYSCKQIGVTIVA